MATSTFLVGSILVYAVLQLVALRVTHGILWRLSFGVAIPAAASVIVGAIGMAMGASMAPVYFMLFAPLGAGVLAVILGVHAMMRLREDKRP